MRLKTIHNTFLAFLFILGCSTLVMAQKFQGGALAGLVSSQIHGDGYAGFNNVGYNVGFFLNSDINEKWLWSFELSYLTKGSYDPPNARAGKFLTQRIRLSYVEAPLYIKYKYKKFLFFGGMSLGVLVSDKQFKNKVEVSGLDRVFNTLNRLEGSHHLGAEYALSDKMNIAWRHSMGFTPISNTLSFDPTFLRFIGGSFNHLMTLSLRRTF